MKYCCQLLFIFICLFTSIAPSVASYEILDTKAHDSSYFTQGYIVDGETLIETSGLYGHSRIKRYHKLSGEVLMEQSFPKSIFAEGISLFDNSIYVLTWKARKMYRLDAQSFETLDVKTYKTEGWGLTHNNKHLIMSDGTHILSFRDPKTFEEQYQKAVTLNNKPLRFINELEFAKGYIWANIYMTPKIVAINPSNGQVEHEFTFAELVRKNQGRSLNKVLNGIAYDPEQDAFWITGKLWAERYLVKLHLKAPPVNQGQSSP